MTNIVYLGRVERVNEKDGGAYRYATVMPVLRSSDDGLVWEGQIFDPQSEFPSRGYVYWHEAPVSLAEGDFVQFEVTNHPYYNGEPDKEAFQVSRDKEAIEVIDLRDYESEAQIRVAVTLEGIFLPTKPLCRSCILWCTNNLFVGPVQLIQQSDSGLWFLDRSIRLDTIKRAKISPEAMQIVRLDGKRRLLRPYEDLTHVGFVNWETDEELAAHVLNRLRKRDRRAVDALNVTKTVFRSYLDTLIDADLLKNESNSLEAAFAGRVEDLVKTLEKRESLLNLAARAFFSAEGLSEKVDRLEREEYERKLNEHVRRLDEDLKDKRSELSGLDKELAEKEQLISAAESRLRSAEEEVEEKIRGFDLVLEERLRKLAEKPEHLFAELAITKALVSKKTHVSSRHDTNATEPDSTASVVVPLCHEVHPFVANLCSRLMDRGVSPAVGMNLHSLLIAGTVPILIGALSYDVISAYAECLTGGILHWIPVGGSIFEPSDLLARFDPVSQTLVPHPGGIVDLLLDESDSTHVVVLEGFNRAPVDGYLIPLLKSFQDVARGNLSPRTIPILPQGLVARSGPYAGISRLAWKKNVLLILCPSTGMSTIPVPTDLWELCSVLGVDEVFPERISYELSSRGTMTRVAASDWLKWSTDVKQVIRAVPTIRECLAELDTLPPFMLPTAERIVASATASGMNLGQATELTARTLLHPYLSSIQVPTDRIFQLLKVTQRSQDSQITDVIRRLGE